MKKIFLIFLFSIFAVFNICATDVLNLKSVSNCLSQTRKFLSDYESYYTLSINYVTKVGRANEGNQIKISSWDDRLRIVIFYQQELYIQWFTIDIEKSNENSDENIIRFINSPSLGIYEVINIKSYDMGDTFSIEYSILELFKSLGF